jgi:hypothetical protein
MYLARLRASECNLRGLTFCGLSGKVAAVSWDRPFIEPIELPKGKKLIALRDAAHYITKLPKAVHDADEWQACELFFYGLSAAISGPIVLLS